MATCCIRRLCSSAASTLCAKISAANSEEAQRHFGGEQNGGEQNSASQPREKRYTQTDGEYVEFEELPGSTDPESPTETTNNTSNTNHTTSYPQEDLISDAEYEEIPN